MREKLVPQQVLEIDIEVAAYAVFQAIFLEKGLPSQYVSEYFNDKARIRAWLAQETALPVKEVKKHLNAMHASRSYKWPCSLTLAANAWIEGLRAEISRAYEILAASSPIYLDLVQEAKKHKEQNAAGAAVSMYREVQERRILDVVSDYLQTRGYPVCGLIHDALLFSAPDLTDQFSQLKLDIEQHVAAALRFPVKFAIEQVRNDHPLPPPPEPETFPDCTIFNDERLQPIWFDYGIRCLAIGAGMNIGKTTEVGRFLLSVPDAKVLIISSRILHAISTKSSFLQNHPALAARLRCYLDKDLSWPEFRNPSEGQINILQNESLHKLLEHYERDGTTFKRLVKYDIIVIDEVRSLLKQTTIEKTHRGNLKANQTLLESLCKKAHCVLLDADLFLDRTVAKFCLARMGGLWKDDEIEVHRYTHQALPRTVLITQQHESFEHALKQAVDAARLYRQTHGRSRPVILNCRCKKNLRTLVAGLFPKPEGAPPPVHGQDNAFVFTGDDNEGIEAFHDINKFVRETPVDLIAHSPKLTCGASLEEPVTAAFCDATGDGCVIRDFSQGCGRARNVDGEFLHMLIPAFRKVEHLDEKAREEEILQLLTDRRTMFAEHLAKFYPDLVEAKDESDDEHIAFESQVLPTWVENNIACNLHEEHRTRHDPAMEVLRLIQFRKWGRVFVDIEAERFGFFAPREAPTKKRKREQTPSAQVKHEEQERWKVAFDEVKALPAGPLIERLRNKQIPVWEQACALLFHTFAAHAQELEVAHAQWYWKHRAVLFHARTLCLSPDEIARLDLDNLLFAFRKKNLATAHSVTESLDALKKALASVKVSLEAFIAADGTCKIPSHQVEQAGDVLAVAWATTERIHGCTQRSRARVSALALLRRLCTRYGRSLDTVDAERKNTVQSYTITLDPLFRFLWDRVAPRE